jgi:hypothetical protein
MNAVARSEPAVLRDVVRDHVPLVATGLVLIFVFTRVYFISHGSLQTAQAMLSASGTVEVIFGTLLSALPALGALIMVLGAAHFGPRHATNVRALGVAVVIVGLLFVLLTAPLAVAVWALLFTAVAIPVCWKDPSLRRRSTIVKVLAVMIPIVLFVFLSDDPWLPAELISFRDGSYLVGYVLSADDDSLVVLVERGRAVTRVAHRI